MDGSAVRQSDRSTMVSTPTPVCEFGLAAPPFSLRASDGAFHTPDTLRGPAGLLVMFICNHCPYVQAILPRLIPTVRELRTLGFGAVAIMSNDTDQYPQDGPDAMAALARDMDFPFPYLLDADQSVARACGAVCTPDFFGYNGALELQYRGRFDASRKEAAPPDTRRDLYEAMREVAQTGRGPRDQTAGIGCSIKWRQD
jgi:peroxiredoxin